MNLASLPLQQGGPQECANTLHGPDHSDAEASSWLDQNVASLSCVSTAPHRLTGPQRAGDFPDIALGCAKTPPALPAPTCPCPERRDAKAERMNARLAVSCSLPVGIGGTAQGSASTAFEASRPARAATVARYSSLTGATVPPSAVGTAHSPTSTQPSWCVRSRLRLGDEKDGMSYVGNAGTHTTQGPGAPSSALMIAGSGVRGVSSTRRSCQYERPTLPSPSGAASVAPASQRTSWRQHDASARRRAAVVALTVQRKRHDGRGSWMRSSLALTVAPSYYATVACVSCAASQSTLQPESRSTGRRQWITPSRSPKAARTNRPTSSSHTSSATHARVRAYEVSTPLAASLSPQPASEKTVRLVNFLRARIEQGGVARG